MNLEDKMKKYLYLIIFFLSFILLLSCGSKVKEDEMFIGATLPLTGDAAQWGKNTQDGINLAVEEINNNDGILGKKISIVYEDTKALPKEGINAYQKLRTEYNVQAIIDDSVSSVTLSMAPMAEKDQVVILATGATAPKITEAGDFIFRIWNSDLYEGEFVAKYAFEKMNLKKIAIVYINNDYGKGLEEVFKLKFKQFGGEVTDSAAFDQNTTDYKTQLVKINANKPEAIYLVGYPKEIPLVLKQIKEMGLKARLLGTVAMQDDQLLKIAGNAAEGLIFPYPEDPTGDNVKRFEANYTKKYGKKPGITSDVGYDAVYMIKNAIELTKNFNGISIKDGLYKIENFPGASGKMTFDKNGDVHKLMNIKVVNNGNFEWIN